jgi:hypothetical protein
VPPGHRRNADQRDCKSNVIILHFQRAHVDFTGEF